MSLRGALMAAGLAAHLSKKDKKKEKLKVKKRKLNSSDKGLSERAKALKARGPY